MAIKALAWMVRAFEPPVYCYHEIVHNQSVVNRFRERGVIFIDDIADMAQAILDNSQDGDVVLCMGAGSIGAVPARVVELSNRLAGATHGAAA